MYCVIFLKVYYTFPYCGLTNFVKQDGRPYCDGQILWLQLSHLDLEEFSDICLGLHSRTSASPPPIGGCHREP